MLELNQQSIIGVLYTDLSLIARFVFFKQKQLTKY